LERQTQTFTVMISGVFFFRRRTVCFEYFIGKDQSHGCSLGGYVFNADSQMLKCRQPKKVQPRNNCSRHGSQHKNIMKLRLIVKEAEQR